jgi:hypothetical protein
MFAEHMYGVAHCLIDRDGRAIGAEPRRRHCHAVCSAPVSFVR